MLRAWVSGGGCELCGMMAGEIPGKRLLLISDPLSQNSFAFPYLPFWLL